MDLKTSPLTFLPKWAPLDSPPAKPPLSGKGARREAWVGKLWKASKGNEKNTSHCTHSFFCPAFACVSLWKRQESTFFKILALERNASQAEMSASLCPDCRPVLLLLTLDMTKPSPFPCTLGMIHRPDEISSPHSAPLYWIFITIQRSYKLHFYLSSLAASPHPCLKTMSYSDPAALDIQVNLCSGPWGQLSHIYFSPPFRKPIWASTSPPIARWVRLWVAQGWAHHLSHCPTHSSSCWTVTCWVKFESLKHNFPAIFILGDFKHCFFRCIPTLEIWFCWLLTLQ